MKDNKFWTVISKPASILLAGAAPAMAAAADLRSGLFTGLITAALLIVFTLLAMTLKNVITSSFRLPVFAILAVAVCASVRMELHALQPEVYGKLGIYITLLGLAVAFFAVAQTEIEQSFGKALGNSIKAAMLFLLAVVLTAFICELFGSGTIMGVQKDVMTEYKNAILAQPAGKIMVYGLVAGLCGLLRGKKEEAK